MEKIISGEFNKIFNFLNRFKYHSEKIITVTDYQNKKYEIFLKDYLWYFYQSLKINSDFFKEKDFICLNQYMYYDLMENIDENKFSWVKNNCTGNVKIQFSENKTSINFINKGYLEVILDNKNKIYSYHFGNFCKDFISKIKDLNCGISTTFLSIENIEESFSHSTVLFTHKEDKKITFFYYDPNGRASNYNEKMEVFLESLKNRIQTTEVFKNNFQNIEIFPFFENGIQSLTDLNTQGYCVIYSLFFTFCFFKILYVLQSNNYNVDIIYVFKKIQSFFLSYNQSQFLNIIFSFANYIKDKYMSFIFKNFRDKYFDFLNQINYNIMHFVDKNIIYHEAENIQEILNISQNTRNYDEEIKEYLESGIIGKYENEECKENKECISNICENNKCTYANCNDKLEFLSLLESKKNNVL